jgi:uncharacterized protein (DUF697 family)
MDERFNEDTTASQLANYLLEAGLNGMGPLSSAEDLAAEYLGNPGFRDDDQRVNALIRREARKNFTTGFVTGLGGLVTFPVAIPAALAASWVLQARMAGAIACIYGQELGSERVKTEILLSLAGDVAKEAMKDLGLKVDGTISRHAVEQIPGRALVEINKRIGARMLTTVGQRVVLKFPRAVPILGGVVGGSLDAMVCRLVGRTAKSLFRPPAGVVLEGEVAPARRLSNRKKRKA